MTFSRNVGLAWLASAALPPDTLREILRTEPDPLRLMDQFSRTGTVLPEEPLADGFASVLRKNLRDSMLEKWQELMERQGIRALTWEDRDYPSRLLPLPEAPAILFYQGNPEALTRDAAAMVGSRNASWKGLEATRKIAEQLSRRDIAIVSGLAYGIDAAAHQGCLRGGSPTIAVLGCGLDQDYPQENAGLRKEMLEKGGLVLSEYAPGEKPLGWHFPWRNRIISGLGECLLVMEARIRSGSMTTVQHALSQGKDVFVYPGEPGSAKSEGNHQLLREGAIYFAEAEDILEDMGWLDKKKELSQNSESSASRLSLSPEEERILSLLEKGEMGFDELCAGTGIPAGKMNALMSMLQIQGLVQALPGKIYRLTPGSRGQE